MTGSPILLEADGLAVQIADRWICCDLSMQMRAGERLVLLGPNGAGKTTLLHTLAGLRAAQQGSVRLMGECLGDWKPRALACARGVLPQRQPDWFSASVLETALVGRHPHLGRWAWEGPEDVRIATAALKQATGRKGKTLFLPLRQALTGRDHGPDMAALLPLIGRERALARLTV